MLPQISFINIDGSGKINPLVNVLLVAMDRRDGGGASHTIPDLVQVSEENCKHKVYVYTVDWRGAERFYDGDGNLPAFLHGKALDDLQNGRAILLIDDSIEACRFSPDLGSTIFRLLEERRIPDSALQLVSQNVAFINNFRLWLQQTGRRDIEMGYYSYFLAAIAQSARLKFQDRKLWETHLANAHAKVFGQRETQRKFICMNNMPKAHRLGVLINMMREGLLKEGFVSFAGHEVISNAYPKPSDLLYAASTLLDVHGPRGEEIRRSINEIHTGPGLVIDRDVPGVARSGNITNDLNLEFFGNSLFTIHCETEFTNGVCSRITEKTYKPLINFHPFVMFGDPYTLKLVQKLGFKTFSSVIDESYDEELDPARRFAMAWREASRLARMPADELQRNLQTLWPILRYNAQYALDGLGSTLLFRDGYDIVDRLISRFRVGIRPG